MTDWTRLRVSRETSGRALITRETVWVETPAAEATCLIVSRLDLRGIVIDHGIDNILAGLLGGGQLTNVTLHCDSRQWGGVGGEPEPGRFGLQHLASRSPNSAPA